MKPMQLMDTTLRDGEQTPDVGFDVEEKLTIAKALLCEVGVDRIEVCSARVSLGERRAAERIAEWARNEGRLSQVEVLGYCDGDRSVEWIRSTGLRCLNLLVKGSERHCRLQLGQTLEGHLGQVERTLSAAGRAGIELSGVYLEDWSSGVAESSQYVFGLGQGLRRLGARRLYLADTLGILNPAEVRRHVRRMRREFPDLLLEFHAHDDYGLATANCLAAAQSGVDGLHTTVNGLGERAGNACLSQVAVVVRDHGRRVTHVDETRLPALSAIVARASGCPVAHNAPVVGRNAFTQTAGVHADGDTKAKLYHSKLAPERFTRQRDYALGKLAGRASLAHHLMLLGIALSPAESEALLARVVALGDRKCAVRAADLPGLVAAIRRLGSTPSEAGVPCRSAATKDLCAVEGSDYSGKPAR
jgi:D-citramalate synthase